jgi:ferredoxin
MGIIGFLLIINSEHAADMFNRPRATAILLLVIIGGVIITNAFFGKRSWCKYICPLGKMIGLFSTASLVELGSNSNVCSGQCQSFDCVKENNCPMGLHPSVATVSKDCVFCFACIRKCPHKSIHIDAHLPWQRLLAKVKWDFADSFFSVALTASVIAAKLPSWGPLDRFLADRLAFLHQGNILGGLAISGTIILIYLAVVLLASGFPAGTSWKQYFTVCGDSYLFLAMTGFLNVYLHEFVYRGHNLIPWTLERTGLDWIIPPGMITPDLGTLRMLIPLITLGGLAVSLYVLRKIARRQELPGTILNAHRVLLCASAGLFLVII